MELNKYKLFLFTFILINIWEVIAFYLAILLFFEFPYFIEYPKLEIFIKSAPLLIIIIVVFFFFMLPKYFTLKKQNLFKDYKKQTITNLSEFKDIIIPIKGFIVTPLLITIFYIIYFVFKEMIIK